MEEIRDEDAPPSPTPAQVSDAHPTAGRVFQREYEGSWERRRADDEKRGQPAWAPFDSFDEWTFARFLMKSGMGHGKIDEFLHLPIVSTLFLLLKHT